MKFDFGKLNKNFKILKIANYRAFRYGAQTVKTLHGKEKDEHFGGECVTDEILYHACVHQEALGSVAPPRKKKSPPVNQKMSVLKAKPKAKGKTK